MRGMAVGAMLAAAALWVAVPAMAAPRSLSAPLSLSGGVTVSWHGDRARGCAAAGLCDYRGSVTAPGAGEGSLELDGSGRAPDVYGYLDPEQRPIVRVQRGLDGACVDATDGEYEVEVGRPRAGRVRVAVAPYGLDRGRCAGPELAQVLERLPGRNVSWRRLRDGGLTVPLERRVSYSNGRFSGTVTSTLRLHVGRFGTGDLEVTDQVSRPSRSHRVRVAELEAVYRVTGLSGSMETDFAGLDAPLCDAFDACGVSGSSRWAVLSASGGTVVIGGVARARPGDRGLRGALAAIRRTRAGVSSYGSVRHALGTTGTLLSRPGGRTCSDSQPVAAPGMAFSLQVARIPLALGGEEENALAGDFVHTGCPGPTESDVLGGGSLAEATLPLSAVRSRRLEVPMNASARFHGPGYSGARRGRFTLGLRRVALHVSYRQGRP